MQTQSTTTLRALKLSLLLVSAIATGTHAQGLLVDQSLQPPPAGGSPFHSDEALAYLLTPGTGQEFTPSLQGLDFVDVNLINTTGAVAGSFAVAIHAGDITAPVLALSSQTPRSEALQASTHFTFPGTVPLIPGDLYVLEVIQLSGDPGWRVIVPLSVIVNGHAVDVSYPGGRMIYGGVPQPNRDLIFQEGIVVVPEPRIANLCLFGLFPFLFRRK